MTHAYEKVNVQGHELDEETYAAFLVAQAHPHKDNDWTILQGSYTSANPSSGGTHDGGGAIDISAYQWRSRVRALRMVGFAAWHRPLNWDGHNGGEHIHAILIGNAKMSPAAAAQIPQYVNYQNGLANAGPDDSWHPFPKGGTPPVFQWDAYQAEVNRVTHLTVALARSRDAIHGALANAQNDGQAKALHDQLRQLGHMRSEFRYQIDLYVKQEKR